MGVTPRRWHEDDPVSDAERARAETIRAEQGSRNPFIEDPTLVERIDDFR
jgi:deoxyribonuclease-1